MQKNAFRLHTTPDSFTQLLSDLTRFVHLRKFTPRFPTKRKGYFSLQPAQLAVGETGHRLITLNMMCSYILEGKGPTPDYPEFWAIRFITVPPDSEQLKVTAECCHEPVMHYFHQLLKRIGYPFPSSPRESESIIQTWPESIRIKMGDLRQTTRPLPFDGQEICRQLQALCDYDAQFLIRESRGGDTPKELTILDAEAVRQACTAREATIGMAGLVSGENGIVLKFIPRDAPFHRKTPGRGRSLFRRFIQRADRHFRGLSDRQRGQEELQHHKVRKSRELNLQMGKPGRKPDPLYDEAYQKIRSGESANDVFTWFCCRARIKKPDKGVRDAFKSAMKRRENNS